MNITISSLNVSSMGDKLKRRETFNWLIRAKNFHIYLLQEVHCSTNTPFLWSSEWGYKSVFRCLSSARGGVAILFNNTSHLKFCGSTRTQTADSLFATSKLKINVSPWQTYMLPTMTNLADSFKISLST